MLHEILKSICNNWCDKERKKLVKEARERGEAPPKKKNLGAIPPPPRRHSSDSPIRHSPIRHHSSDESLSTIQKYNKKVSQLNKMSPQQLNTYLASLEPDEAQAWRLVVQETGPPIARMQGNSIFIAVFIPFLFRFYIYLFFY